jgi:hypothetical protein
MAQFPQYLPVCRHACRSLGEGFGSAPAWLQNRSSPKVVECRNLALASGLCQAVGMAKKRTKADRLERQTEQLGKRADRCPDEIEKEPSTLAPKSDEPTVLIPIEQQIQQRAYELYEQRGRTDGHDLDDWLQAEYEIRGTQANPARA